MLDLEVDDKRAIRDLVDSWMEASARGETEAILGMMTDDVLFMTPGGEPFGKEQFRKNAETLKDANIDGRSDIQEIEILGDRAWVRNHIEFAMTPPDGKRIQRSGYALTIFKKSDDGRWRLYRDANLVT
jgi:uncharacterized protein (TIGR02246 family)